VIVVVASTRGDVVGVMVGGGGGGSGWRRVRVSGLSLEKLERVEGLRCCSWLLGKATAGGHGQDSTDKHHKQSSATD
jgi:hypothetical protein